jgi:hypothetical protein
MQNSLKIMCNKSAVPFSRPVGFPHHIPKLQVLVFYKRQHFQKLALESVDFHVWNLFIIYKEFCVRSKNLMAIQIRADSVPSQVPATLMVTVILQTEHVSVSKLHELI